MNPLALRSLPLFIVCLLLSPITSPGAPETDRVKRVEASGQFPALAIHPTARKLFAAQNNVSNPHESGLWVFDIDKLGDITTSDERVLPILPEKTNSAAYCSCLRFSPDGRKLYLGVNAGNLADNPKTLVVFDLDEKGEPKGKPRAYANGNPNFCIWDILPHPKADVLYSVGWGGAGVYSMPLTKGEPSGEPIANGVGGAGKISIVANETGDTLFLGAYPCIIESVGISSDGEVEKPLPGDTKRVLKAADVQMYLPVSILGHSLYFAVDYALYSWPLDKNWQPVGKPQKYPEIQAGLVHISGDHLFVADYKTAPDEATKKPVPLGFRILEFKPDEKGAPGKPLFESPFIAKAGCTSMVADPKTGIIYVSY